MIEIRCFSCDGHGLISDYGVCGTDFEGAKECLDCEGSGRLFVTAQCRLVPFPGGPFKGSITKQEYEKLKGEKFMSKEPKDSDIWSHSYLIKALRPFASIELHPEAPNDAMVVVSNLAGGFLNCGPECRVTVKDIRHAKLLVDYYDTIMKLTNDDEPSAKNGNVDA